MSACYSRRKSIAECARELFHFRVHKAVRLHADVGGGGHCMCARFPSNSTATIRLLLRRAHRNVCARCLCVCASANARAHCGPRVVTCGLAGHTRCYNYDARTLGERCGKLTHTVIECCRYHVPCRALHCPYTQSSISDAHNCTHTHSRQKYIGRPRNIAARVLLMCTVHTRFSATGACGINATRGASRCVETYVH